MRPHRKVGDDRATLRGRDNPTGSAREGGSGSAAHRHAPRTGPRTDRHAARRPHRRRHQAGAGRQGRRHRRGVRGGGRARHRLGRPLRAAALRRGARNAASARLAEAGGGRPAVPAGKGRARHAGGARGAARVRGRSWNSRHRNAGPTAGPRGSNGGARARAGRTPRPRAARTPRACWAPRPDSAPRAGRGLRRTGAPGCRAAGGAAAPEARAARRRGQVAPTRRRTALGPRGVVGLRHGVRPDLPRRGPGRAPGFRALPRAR